MIFSENYLKKEVLRRIFINIVTSVLKELFFYADCLMEKGVCLIIRHGRRFYLTSGGYLYG